MRKPLVLVALLVVGGPFLLIGSSTLARAAQIDIATIHPAGASLAVPETAPPESSSAVQPAGMGFPDAPAGEATSPLADPPDPAGASGRDHPGMPTDLTENWTLFSRIGIGADISPLGIGIKSATVLTEVFDARLDGSFYFYSNGRSHVNGVNVDADVHLASMAAKIDWYPMNSVFRLSPGIMFFNGNDLSANLSADPGTSFSVNNVTYYSAKPNPATGAVPATGKVDVGLHSTTPAFTVSGGFGRYIPRSHRHWSFPFEIGGIFMGAPSLHVTVGGWVCKDYQQKICSDLSDQSSPLTIQFNKNLNVDLARYRRDLGVWTVYPIFSYGVMYSFNTPW